MLENTKNFKEVLEEYEYNVPSIYTNELKLYVGNEINLFKGVIWNLSSYLGYASQMVIVNGEAGGGKTTYIEQLQRITPRFHNFGNISEAAFRRKNTHAFDRKVVYLGDQGLNPNQEGYEALRGAMAALVSDKIYIAEIADPGKGKGTYKQTLKSDGLTVYTTQPYTNLTPFKAGDQLVRRSRQVLISKPPRDEDMRSFVLSKQNPDIDKPFENIHRDYIQGLIDNHQPVVLDEETLIHMYNDVNNRSELEMLTGHFQAFNTFLGFNPSSETWDIFTKYFREITVNPVEEKWLEVFKKWFIPLSDDKANELEVYDFVITNRNQRGMRYFFTVRKVKSYVSNWRMNKLLKDTVDNLPDIMNNLWKAGFLGRLENNIIGDNGGEIVYYIRKEDYNI